MASVRRRLLNLLTALSLLLCMAAVVMWARSYFTEDAIQAPRDSMAGRWFDEESWQAWSGWGGLSVCWGHNGGDLVTQRDADDVRARTNCDGRWHYHFVRWNWGPMYGDGSFSRGGRRTYLGFGFDRHDDVNRGSPAGFQKLVMVVVPWPAIVGLFAALPASRVARTRMRRRRARLGALRKGLCKSCGYDLRATPDRCPECGHVPALR
jgi:hypothetical protein